MATHPPCGLYRTTRPLGELPPSRLVFFHNHGDPGPGIYLPTGWNLNRVEWHAQGTTVLDPDWSSTLEPLLAEGLYSVHTAFACCGKNCVQFRAGQLVQLGYDGQATPILFVPEWSTRGLGFPAHGSRLDGDRLANLSLLTVARGAESPRETMLH